MSRHRLEVTLRQVAVGPGDEPPKRGWLSRFVHATGRVLLGPARLAGAYVWAIVAKKVAEAEKAQAEAVLAAKQAADDNPGHLEQRRALVKRTESLDGGARLHEMAAAQAEVTDEIRQLLEEMGDKYGDEDAIAAFELIREAVARQSAGGEGDAADSAS